MASDAGVSTNTLLVVAALAVVAVVMYRRQGAASGMGAASGGAGGRAATSAGDSTSDIIKAATEAAIGVGALIRQYSTDPDKDAKLSQSQERPTYLLTASPAALTFCVNSGYVDENGDPTRECIATYDG